MRVGQSFWPMIVGVTRRVGTDGVFSTFLGFLVMRGFAMLRTGICWCAAVCLLGLSGCSMCCHPYDKSGPVYGADGSSCSAHGRAGSRFASPSESMPSESMPSESMPAEMASTPRPRQATSVAYGKPKLGDVPGSEQIISVTERVVGPASEDGDSSMAAADQPSNPMPASGWTARRPTRETLR